MKSVRDIAYFAATTVAVILFLPVVLAGAAIFLVGYWLVYMPLVVTGVVTPRFDRHRQHRVRSKKGRGLPVHALAERLGMPPDDLIAIRPAYRSHDISKRSGGVRTLHAPDPELKRVQRRILRRLLTKLTSHSAATGFEPGLSIAHNAARHVGQAVVIKLDLKDFFPATGRNRIEYYFRRIGWNAEAAALLTRLTTHEGGLPQGAPTSPRLSNLANHVMDAQIERYVVGHHGTYTRYADDITVSYPEDWPKYVRGTVQHIRKTARRHGYTVHTRKKLRILRRHQRQTVTGLVVNDGVNLPRETRRRLRAAEHRMRTTGRSTHTPEQLTGWRSLQRMIETQRDFDASDGPPDAPAAGRSNT